MAKHRSAQRRQEFEYTDNASVTRRQPVDKKQSAAQFGRRQNRTKLVNVASGPMRGGIRL